MPYRGSPGLRRGPGVASLFASLGMLLCIRIPSAHAFLTSDTAAATDSLEYRLPL